MLFNDHTNAGGIEVEVAAEGAGLADEVGAALAQDGMEASPPDARSALLCAAPIAGRSRTGRQAMGEYADA